MLLVYRKQMTKGNYPLPGFRFDDGGKTPRHGLFEAVVKKFLGFPA